MKKKVKKMEEISQELPLTEKIYLKDGDLRTIDNCSHNVVCAKYELEIQKRKIETLKLKVNLHEKELKLLGNILATEFQVEADLIKKVESRLEEERLLLKDIAQRLNITGRWGYNPDSGEITLS